MLQMEVLVAVLLRVPVEMRCLLRAAHRQHLPEAATTLEMVDSVVLLQAALPTQCRAMEVVRTVMRITGPHQAIRDQVCMVPVVVVVVAMAVGQ